MKVETVIGGILLNCDESVAGIDLGNGYAIRKEKLRDLPYKNKIVDGTGNLLLEYIQSNIGSSKEPCFMCIHKTEDVCVEHRCVLSDEMCEYQLSEYRNKEMKYLSRKLNLLQVFKEGNIGYKAIFFTHKSKAGILTHSISVEQIYMREYPNYLKQYSLQGNEIEQCNYFISNYVGLEYDYLNIGMDRFISALEHTELAACFKECNNSIEYLFIKEGEDIIKQKFSKRVATYIEGNPEKRRLLYKQISKFYKFRSDSEHLAKDEGILLEKLNEYRDIVRKVLKKYLPYCKEYIAEHPNATWEEIRDNKITGLEKKISIAVKEKWLPSYYRKK